MITIAEVVGQMIIRSPFISEALVEGLINVSALARRFQPEVERRLGKSVKPGAIVMAINRTSFGELLYINRNLQAFFRKVSDISVRSNLLDYTFANSETLMARQATLLQIAGQNPKRFCTFSQGIAETTLIVTDNLEASVEELFKEEKRLDKETDLASVTLMLPTENRVLYGVYYYILKDLAWHGINLLELISTSNEFSIVVKQKDLDRAFSLLLEMRRR